MSERIDRVLGEEYKSPKPNRSKMNADEVGLRETVDELLLKWDRAEFSELCRKLEILMLRGKIDAAVMAIRNFTGFRTEIVPKLDDHITTFVSLRVANRLDEYGYSTVGAALRAKPEDLLGIPNIGKGAIDELRRVGIALKNRTPIARVVDRDQSPELAPEWEIDWEYLATVAPDLATERAYKGKGDEHASRESNAVHRKVR